MNWEQIDSLTDRKIDTSDIPEQGKALLKRATLRLPEPKTAVTIRSDRQGLNWFKAKGPGYQTRIKRSFGHIWKHTKDEVQVWREGVELEREYE
jgi:uncharacterized protein (DUF4415 family)